MAKRLSFILKGQAFFAEFHRAPGAKITRQFPNQGNTAHKHCALCLSGKIFLTAAKNPYSIDFIPTRQAETITSLSLK